MQLQQILFFKELGFSLKQIQKVLGRSDFDQLAALYSHRKSLSQEGEKIGQLLKTIDKTIQHLQGKKAMNDNEIFDGFNISLVTKAKGDESYFAAEALVLKSVKNPTVEKREKAFYDNLVKAAHAIFKDLVLCMDKGQDSHSEEVQQIIKKHHAFTEQIHQATQEVYKAMAQLYREHPAYRQQLDPFHPQLAEFMAQAMAIFAERQLA
ncbi:MAG: TipAS antibiotic-recognition domain-containing protein [Verrucomicrobia bacterium]|nr:TipAS antibiotic-recognition domain-containing protein [Verrucomicrobiota bacterium]